MPPPRKGDTTLSKPGDWLDWYESLLDFARGHELEDLVDIEKNKPVSEILLPKPEKPNPLALFPQLLDTLPPVTLKQVAIPILDEKGVTVEPPQYTFVRNQAIEDDALVHLTGAQVAGWKARLHAYNQREAQWRNQRKSMLAIRRWIDGHIDLMFAYRTRNVEDVREAVQALRCAFPHDEETSLARRQFDDICSKAATAGLKANEWLRQWCLAYDRLARLEPDRVPSNVEAWQFLLAAGRYNQTWAATHMSELRKGDSKVNLPDLINNFHVVFAYHDY